MPKQCLSPFLEYREHRQEIGVLKDGSQFFSSKSRALTSIQTADGLARHDHLVGVEAIQTADQVEQRKSFPRNHPQSDLIIVQDGKLFDTGGFQRRFKMFAGFQPQVAAYAVPEFITALVAFFHL